MITNSVSDLSAAGPDDGAVKADADGTAAAPGVGHFDEIRAGVATGWAFVPGRPAVAVQILADGQVVAEVVADRRRIDVADAGHTQGQENVGFEYRIPADAARETRCFSARILDGFALTEIHKWQDPDPVRLSGYFTISHGLVQGAFCLASEVAQPASLLLEENGNLLQTLIPVYEPAEETKDTLVASFADRVPVGLRNGALHRLTLRVADTSLFLAAEAGGHEMPFQAFVRGVIDSVEGGIVAGWAFDNRHPGTPVLIECLDADRVIAQGYTDQKRSDVARQYPEALNSGFSIALPLALFDGALHHLRVRCGGEYIVGACAAGTPEPLEVDAGGSREQRILGRVERLDWRRVSGWAYETGSDLPVTIRIEVDGITIAKIVPNNFERRLALDGRHGYHCYSYDFPLGLMNGRSRRVRVIPVGSATPLQSAVEATMFPLTILPDDQPGGRIPIPPALTPAVGRISRGRGGDGRFQADAGQCLVSLIVINWNGAGYLGKMLDSLARLDLEFPYEVLLVDHGSTDRSAAVAQDWANRLPLHWLPRGANFSFSQSNNFGAARAKGKFLLFANNDLEFDNDCITPALARFDDPSLAILGFRLLEPVPQEDGWSLRDHHIAIAIQPTKLTAARSVYLPYEIGSTHLQRHTGQIEVGSVTAALMMCRTGDFIRLGGFSEAYSYGLEDVDLCLRASKLLKKSIICDQTLHAVHDRSATRGRKSSVAAATPPYSAWQQKQNRAEFLRRHARYLARTILQEAMDGSNRLARRPLRVTFAVTNASIHTSAGDYFTAMELGLALRDAYGWDILFVHHAEYDLADSDVLIVMRHDYDLARVVHAAPSLVVIAWVRNRLDQWCAGPNLRRCNLVFASSRLAIEEIAARTGITAALLPIATNERRFRPPEHEDDRKDLVFTGNFWGAPRETAEMVDLDALGLALRIYGASWNGHPNLAQYWRGNRPYYDLPAIYAGAEIVLDDSHPVTRKWNSLNSRVFDAIAAGSLVITNCRGGAAELFGDLLPSYETAEELNALLAEFAADPEKRRTVAARLRDEVLQRHTYAARAATLHASLSTFCKEKLRVAIKIGVPKAAEREQWGDYHFAVALKRALERAGFWVRIDILPEWDAGYAVGDDVAIVLRGLSRHKPAPGILNIMWLISHPDQVTVEEMLEYDHVFIASEPYATRLQARLGDRVSPLLQCTDPTVFFPVGADEPAMASQKSLFVGNTRGQSRQLIDWALQEDVPFDLYGGGWAATPAAGRLVGDHIPNDQLRLLYGTAPIVLCDHWPDMRAEGFLSNRLFDVAGCGSLMAVDEIAGIESVFGDLVAVCRHPNDLTVAVREATATDAPRRERGQALRALVLGQHTFDHRARKIADMIERLQ